MKPFLCGHICNFIVWSICSEWKISNVGVIQKLVCLHKHYSLHVEVRRQFWGVLAFALLEARPLLIDLFIFVYSFCCFTLGIYPSVKRVGTASLSILDLLLPACNPVPQTEAIITRTTMFLITPHKVKSSFFVGRCWKKKAPPLGYRAWNLSTATVSWGRMSNIDGSCLLWEEDPSSLEQNFHLSEQWDLKMERVVLQAPCSPLLLFLVFLNECLCAIWPFAVTSKCLLLYYSPTSLGSRFAEHLMENVDLPVRWFLKSHNCKVIANLQN